jgi:hypothetical protein
MNGVLRDRELGDLIERCQEARDVLDATFEPAPAEFHEMADKAAGALHAAADFLLRLRERS